MTDMTESEWHELMKMTPLHSAAMRQDPDVDEDYDTLPRLHQAAYDGDLHIIKYLVLERGARLGSLDNDGCSALQVACVSGELDAVKLLIELGSDLYHLNYDGDNCLIIAVNQENGELIRMLLKHKMDVFAVGTDGVTAREFAAQYDLYDIVDILAEEEATLAKCAAFAMSHHQRLGAQSMAKALDPEVLRMIINRV
jgi:ankyrin repeat protein